MSKILKSVIIYIFILILALPVFAGDITDLPRTVAGRIDDPPSTADLSFYAYMDTREDEILLGNSDDDYDGGTGIWTIDVNNFDTLYSPDLSPDTIHVVLVDKETEDHFEVISELLVDFPHVLDLITLTPSVPETPDFSSGVAEPGQVRLIWDAEAGITYDILRSEVPGGPVYYRINDVNIETSPYIDNDDVTAGRTYYYRLIAKNAGGSGAYSNEQPVDVIEDSLCVLVSIRIEEPKDVELSESEEHPFTATGLYNTNGADSSKPVAATWSKTWTEGDEDAPGTLSSDGLYTAPPFDKLELLGQELGQDIPPITITASYTEGDILETDTATVTLVAPVLTSIDINIDAESNSVPVGESRDLTATASYSNVPERDITDSVEWIVLNETVDNVGTVNEDGKFTAHTEGEITIQARREGMLSENTLTIKVIPDLSRIDEIEAKIDPSVVRANEEAIITTVAIDGNNEADVQSCLYSYSVTGPDGNEYDDLINNEDGIFIFTAGDIEGTYTITVTLQTDPEDPETILETDVEVEVDLSAPTISIKVDGKKLESDTIIGSQPRFEITLSDGNGINKNALELKLDGKLISFSSQPTVMGVGTNAVSYSLTLEDEISAGTHKLTIEFEDGVGHKGSVEYTGIKVYGSLSIVGITRNYPNPFKPSVGTTLYYELTQDASVKIYIYDLAGRLVYSTLCEKGKLVGGSAGVNPVPWDGKNMFDEYVANGVYVYFLLSADGKILDRGEMACYE